MSITFGIGSLSVLENRPLDAVVTDFSASASTLTAASDVNFMVDGITGIVSATVLSITALMGTGEGQTGSGLMLYTHLGANVTTGTYVMVSAADPLNTATNIHTAICPILKFSFGTGANDISTIALVSGGSATKTIGKVQNVSINISYENAQMRGGGDIFPVDTKFFDGSVEGSFEFGDNTATQLLFFGGTYTSAGASSGTWTLSGTSKPISVSLVFQHTTDGTTGTYRVMKAYLTQQTNDFSRTEFMVPSYTFMSQSNIKGTTLTVTQ